ncbi:MAG TPA: hypothetical protein VIR57_07590 [Chloroflexota bacterium]
MLIVHDGFAVDADPGFGRVPAAQVLQQHLTHLGIFGRTLIVRVLMANHE